MHCNYDLIFTLTIKDGWSNFAQIQAKSRSIDDFQNIDDFHLELYAEMWRTFTKQITRF